MIAAEAVVDAEVRKGTRFAVGQHDYLVMWIH